MPENKQHIKNTVQPQKNKKDNTNKAQQQTHQKLSDKTAGQQKSTHPKNNLPAVKTGYKKSHFPVRKFIPKAHKESLAEKLTKTFTSLISKGIKTLIPWVLGSTILFTLSTYYVFYSCFIDKNYPLWYVILCAVILFAVFIFFGFSYGLIMGLLYTVKSFSQAFGGIIRDSINRIKNSIESKIDKAADSLSKNEAAKIVKQTFDDLSANIRKYAAKTAAGVAAITILGALVFICRKFLIKSFSTIKNKADFFAILSARTALVAAIILNLTFFTKLTIAAGYLIGIAVLSAQGFMVLLLK